MANDADLTRIVSIAVLIVYVWQMNVFYGYGYFVVQYSALVNKRGHGPMPKWWASDEGSTSHTMTDAAKLDMNLKM